MTLEFNFTHYRKICKPFGHVECRIRGLHTASHVILPILLHIQVITYVVLCVSVDMKLPQTIQQLLQNMSFFLCAMIVLLYVSPYSVAVILLAVLVSAVFLGRPHRYSTHSGPCYCHMGFASFTASVRCVLNVCNFRVHN
jgi:hypothetical protein